MPGSHLDDHLVAVAPAHGLDPGVVDHLADLLAVADRLELDVRLLCVGRLDLELLTSEGASRGLLARLRDVLPGRYSFGVTGRDPAGSILPVGDYVLRLVAYPTVGGRPSQRTIAFSIK